MQPRVGPAAQVVLSHAPLPDGVADALLAEHRTPTCGNPHLSEAVRLRALAGRCPSTVAAELCRHRFSPAGAIAVADRERRKTPLRVLAAAADRDALDALLTHRNATAVAVAAERAGRRPYPNMPVELLVERLDVLDGVSLLRALFAAPPDLLDDDTVAAEVIRCNVPGDADGSWVVDHVIAGLMLFRPGLTDALAARGFEGFPLGIAAFSPHLRPRTAATFAAACAELPYPAAAQIAAQNPWANGTVGGSPAELTGAELDAAMALVQAVDAMWFTKKHVGSLRMCFAANPNLGAHAPAVADALREDVHRAEFHGYAATPPWVRDPLLAAFHENYPHLELRDTQGHNECSGDVEAEFTDPLVEVCCSELTDLDDVHRDAALSALAVALGGDVEVWRTALLLVSDLDGTLAELVEVAAATTLVAA